MTSELRTQETVPEARAPEFSQNTASMEDDATSPTSDSGMPSDPFASQREPEFKWDPFSTERRPSDALEPVPMSQRDRRMSKEWDASKVPPSRFQKREGSIHATPASRDGHIDRNKLKVVSDKIKKKVSS